MKKYLLFGLLIQAALLKTAGQTPVNISYFETYTKQAHPRASSGFSFNRDSIINRISGIPDSAGVIATLVTTVNDIGILDSLSYTLINSLGQVTFTGGGNMSSLQSSTFFRIDGNTIYYTVGPYPYLKHFTATVRIKGIDGGYTPLKTFTKN